jgi:hypothetical protein
MHPLPEEEPYDDDYENEVIGMEKYISFYFRYQRLVI